jgi:L-lactate dehydrogenase complex protein LldF
MGLEKVIERLSDLPPLLRLLTGSATGQVITTYVNMITSPRKYGEKDGPKEIHLIILDNGRSKIFNDPQYREILKCIRCGTCLNHCLYIPG